MFDNLLESRATRHRDFASQVASVALHAGVITAIAVASRGVVHAHETPVYEELVFVRQHPPVVQPVAPAPTAVTASRSPDAPMPALALPPLMMAVEIPDVLPRIDVASAVINAADLVRRGMPGGVVDGIAGGVAGGIADSGIHVAQEVDKPAVLLAPNGTPEYPELLKAAGVEGDVLVTFVVGMDGRAERSTLRVVGSSHRLFTSAVRDALSLMRFLPAEVRGAKVRQLVEMPFQFRIR